MTKTISRLSWSLTVVLLLTLSGCATLPKPQTPYLPGAQVETLTAMVSLSVKTDKGSLGGNGYMIYRRPDRFHLVILTPFGTTAVEMFADDGRLTFVVPSKGVAYAGTFDELPEEGALQGWRLMKWVVEGDPLFDPGKPGAVERTDAAGRKVTAFYDGEGLLVRKLSADGDEVVYRDYRSADGVPFPSVIEFTDRRGARVRIAFDEAEINGPVEDAALTPNLDGITVLPLASFKGA